MTQFHIREGDGFVQRNIDAIIVVLIIICILLVFCCALLMYMVYLYKHELDNYRKEAIKETITYNKNDIVNISTNDSVDITANPNNLKILPVTPISVLENDSINDFTMYNSCNSKSYNKKFISMNSDDDILSGFASPKQAFDTTSNINDYLSHSYSYNTNIDKLSKYQYHHRKNNSLINNNHKRFPSIKKPKNLYERQSSISSTIGSVKSMLKRHYSIRSKNHSRNHSSTNSKIPSILIQNNIPLHFINEELDSKSSSLNEYCQSVTSSVTDNNNTNNNNLKSKLNYLSSSSSKIKYDEDLPITDILIPSSSYSYSSKTMLCNNSYDNYNHLFSDNKNDDFINTVNNIELNNMYKDNYNSNKIYQMAYNNKKPEESIYSLSPYSDYSDGISYINNLVEEPEDASNGENNLNKEYDKSELEDMKINSKDISTLNIEYKKEE